jgi:hypothetical protein
MTGLQWMKCDCVDDQECPGSDSSVLMWEKTKTIDSGLYLCGGGGDVPVYCPTAIVSYDKHTVRASALWFARISDLPPRPKMPPPTLKDGDPVLVRDSHDGSWQPRHFAGWSKNGWILAWANGTKWASRGKTFYWEYWRLPTKEELVSE